MEPLTPCSPPNALQQALLARLDQGRSSWAPEQRARAQALDRYLVGWGGVGAGLGLLGGLAGLTLGLRGSGASWPWALVISLLYGLALLALSLQAWRDPERFTPGRLARVAWLMLLATYASTLALAWRRRSGDGLRWPEWHELPGLLWAATPIQLLLALTALLYVWQLSSARRKVLQAELERLQLTRQRDLAERSAAEARLRLLQVQIQPHFIFNTLAALQHWVDTGDVRAAALLRSLTGFLRASTDLMAREQVSVAEEVAMVTQYLAIQHARLGGRLQTELSMPPALMDLSLPPGVLLTLVENALEHGITPALQGGSLVLHGALRGATACLWVDNSGQPLDEDAARRAGADAADLPAVLGAPVSVGLQNCRERLQRLAGAQASLGLLRLPDGRTRAEICLPWRAA
ncbi:sensor histidine kinase [Ideonella sp.]|uniref:sensor histidine kinase n=1 Tax=Ideonella sp. TaxID=1929293 RepID=UPI003BB4CCEB